MDVSPALKAALLFEIERALPGLLKKAMTAIEAPKTNGAAPIGSRKRLKRGLPKIAILKAIGSFFDKGASRQDIKRIAPKFLNGKQLNEHTLKRWLFVLKSKEEIENMNGRWFLNGDAAHRARHQDFTLRADDYQEKDDL